jgi:DNA-directed RNA polymerase subunit L/DNA-directed RNA polymerase alpha subunit
MFSEYSENGPNLFGNNGKLRASFRVKGIHVTMANTLRRAILTLTPSVGFRTEPYEKSDVVVKTNTTPLVNDMIVHRVGMIPIYADPLTFDPARYEFVLDKENNTKELMDVRAADFKVFMRNPENPLEAPTEVPAAQFFPADPITGDTCLITRLRPQWNPTAPNERISLKAKASVSTGAENIRWCPVSQCSYEYTRDNNPEHIKAVFDKWLVTNKKIVDPSSLDETRRGELEREFNTMEIQRCYFTNEKGDPNDFTFFVESIGVIPIPEIVKAAIAACEGLVDKYKDLDGVLAPNVRVQQGDSRFPTVDVIFQNESHSLGNLLETYIVENHIDGGDEPKATYVGYKVPHPLRPEMFVRVGVTVDDTETQKQSVRLIIATACRKLKEQFRQLQGQWSASASASASS